MRMFALIAVALAATGCSTLQSGKVPDRFSGQAFAVNKDIRFLAGDYSVVFQKGQIVRGGGLTVWEKNCKFRMKEAQQESWVLEDGLYHITGYTRFDANCTRQYCVDFQEFSLQTVEGPVAEKLTCREQYTIGDGSLGPEPVTADQLRITLGNYLELRQVGN